MKFMKALERKLRLENGDFMEWKQMYIENSLHDIDTYPLYRFGDPITFWHFADRELFLP